MKMVTSDKNVVSLIDGVFNPESAKDLLIDLLNKKIHFHEMKNLTSHEQTGTEDKFAMHRIAKLSESKSEIEKIIQEAQMSGKKLKIFSNINIELQ